LDTKNSTFSKVEPNNLLSSYLKELGSHIGGVGFSYWRSWVSTGYGSHIKELGSTGTVLILEELGSNIKELGSNIKELGSTLTVLIFGGVGFYGYGSHSFTCG
jgi:hypothetical protein